jgi:quinol monooxygenase YgiN
MQQQIIRLSVSFIVNDGQSEQFLKIAAQMIAASHKEPGTLGYELFGAADSKQYRLVEVYADAEAVEAHFAGWAVLEGVPELVKHCSVGTFEVYGDPGPNVRAMAGGLGAVFFDYKLGLDR